MNSAPLTGPVDASTFRNIAKAMTPTVVNIRTESKQTRAGHDATSSAAAAARPGRLRRRRQRRSARALLRRRPGRAAASNRSVRASRRPWRPAPASSSARTASSSPTTTSSRTRPRSRCRSSAKTATSTYEAKLVGRDPLTDSALIQLTEKPKHALPEAKFGDSAQMAAGRLGHGHRQPVRPRAHRQRRRDQRHRAPVPHRRRPHPATCSRPTPPSTRATRAGRCSTCAARSSASTPRSSPTRASQGNIGIGFAMPINTVRELLPQLRTGKVTRGVHRRADRRPIPRDALEDFGLKIAAARSSSTVAAGGPAAKAGIEPGDVIIEFNGKPVKNRDDWSATCRQHQARHHRAGEGAARQGEKTLQRHRRRARSRRPKQPRPRRARRRPDEQARQGFGITLGALTPDMAARLRLPPAPKACSSPTSNGQPGASARGLARGDVILRVNRQPVTLAAGRQRGAGSGGLGWHRVPAGAAQRPGTVLHRPQGIGPQRRRRRRLGPAQHGSRARDQASFRRAPTRHANGILALGATPLRGRRLQEDCLLDSDDERLLAPASTLRVRAEGGKSPADLQGARRARAS